MRVQKAQTMTDKPVVEAFDFDGTLTHHDTLIPFLIDAAGPWKVSCSILKQLPLMIGYFFGLSTRQQIKEGLLQNTIGGIPLEIVKEKGKEFARKKIRAKLKPEAMRKLQWHQNQGHRCILVSANLDVYLEPWSQMEKLQDTLCSILQVDDKGRITGFLKGKNCRGEEKTKRLLALLGDRKSFILYAYGDSKGDKEMLEIADFPFYRKFD